MKIPKIINQEEFEKLFQASLKKKGSKAKAYSLALLLGFEAGMRISEIVGLKSHVPPLQKEHVDLQQHTIKIVSGKGNKDRVVPLPKRFNQGAFNLLPLSNHLSRRALQQYTTNLGQEVLGKAITFHTLRHGFGSHLASSGRPLHEIQMLMGHSRLDTTGIYLHANPKQAIEGARDVF